MNSKVNQERKAKENFVMPLDQSYPMHLERQIKAQIEKFYQMIRKNFVEEILQLQELKTKFSWEVISKHCPLMQEHELEKEFPLLQTRLEAKNYQDRYCLGNLMPNTYGILYPNGLFKTNHYLNNLIEVLTEQYIKLYKVLSEFRITLQLIMPEYENRNVMDCRFLETFINTFSKFRNIAYQAIDALDALNIKRAKCIYNIAVYPQFEDYRRRFIIEEINIVKILIRHFDSIYYMNHYIFDFVVKNNDQLAEYMNQVYNKHTLSH